MAGGRDPDRDRIGDGAVPRGIEPIERRAGPGRARGVDEGAALRGRLQKALPGRREGGGKLGDRRQRRIVSCGNRPVRMNEEHRVAKSAALADHHREPAPEARRIRDIAGLDRPFDAARIGERADRIGRRQPRHQPVERRRRVPMMAKSRHIFVHRWGTRLLGEGWVRGPRLRAMIVTVVRVMFVGARFRIERRFDRRELRAQAAQHGFQHMIAADAQPSPTTCTSV